MRERIIVDLPNETKAALDDATREEAVSQSELIERALRDYLFTRRFRSLRERMVALASANFSDQDVFDRVS